MQCTIPSSVYDPIFPRKCTPYQVKKHGKDGVLQYLYDTSPPLPRMAGSTRDILHAWKFITLQK